MITMESLTEQYGQSWRLWRSRNGGLVCASRRRALTRREERGGLAPTLVEDDLYQLAEKLSDQSERELTTGELV
jgi:hypothetical protein